MSGHTYTHTYTQDNYSNPRCACAPRVNYQCKMCWNKALTFGVGSIKLRFRTIMFTQYMQRCFNPNIYIYIYIHFSQIALRVCTLVLFIITIIGIAAFRLKLAPLL